MNPERPWSVWLWWKQGSDADHINSFADLKEAEELADRLAYETDCYMAAVRDPKDSRKNVYTAMKVALLDEDEGVRVEAGKPRLRPSLLAERALA